MTKEPYKSNFERMTALSLRRQPNHTSILILQYITTDIDKGSGYERPRAALMVYCSTLDLARDLLRSFVICKHTIASALRQTYCAICDRIDPSRWLCHHLIAVCEG